MLRLKQLLTQIHRDSDDPDAANLERFRPQTNHMSMVAAQIPAKSISTPSPQYMANYDEIDFSQMQSQMDAMAKEIERLQAQGTAAPVGAKPKKQRSPMSDEKKAEASRRMKARWAAKKAAAAAAGQVSAPAPTG